MKISNDMLVEAVEKAEAGVKLRRQREYQLWAKSKWFIYEYCVYNAGTTDKLSSVKCFIYFYVLLCILINPLTPNDTYSGRTAPLTSKRFILHIYSTNVGTEYFKHGV